MYWKGVQKPIKLIAQNSRFGWFFAVSGSSDLEGIVAHVNGRHPRPGDRRHDEHRRRHRFGLPPPGDRAHALLAARDLPEAVHLVAGKEKSVILRKVSVM